MSSTNRGYERHKADYYVTPQKPIEDFLSAFFQDEEMDRPDRKFWFDPCAGGSEKDEMSYPAVIERACEPGVITMDLRDDSRAEMKGDYLFFYFEGAEPDIIITNPPFHIAMEIIQKALKDVTEGGYVIMLLRLNFFGSRERKPFFEHYMPKSCYVHSKRMNFIPDWLAKKIVAEGGKKATGDSIEYAHFVWQKGNYPDFTKLYVL